jgi:hypothetical protein
MAEGKGRSNLQNLFRTARVSSDNQIRNLLDPLEPSLLGEGFAHSLRELAKAATHYFHAAILPMMVKAGESRVLALEPEFITPQDGHEKQDCEQAAIQRWVKPSGEYFGLAYKWG